MERAKRGGGRRFYILLALLLLGGGGMGVFGGWLGSRILAEQPVGPGRAAAVASAAADLAEADLLHEAAILSWADRLENRDHVVGFWWGVAAGVIGSFGVFSMIPALDLGLFLLGVGPRATGYRIGRKLIAVLRLWEEERAATADNV